MPSARPASTPPRKTSPQWRRTSEACPDGVDHAAAADASATALEAEYSREFLGKLAYAGGFVADVTDVDVDRDVLLALEELEDEADRSDLDTRGDQR